MNYWKLGRVLLLVGILIGAVGVYYIWLRPMLEEKPQPLPPPEIKDFRWEPTRVIRSKVYDGRVSFTAEDKDSVISEAHLEFLPIYPPHLPRKSFPEESPRRIKLKPIDGSFDQKMEQFSANITDIKGGKEYEIKAVAKDATDNVAEVVLKTSYIREFEDIAPLDDKQIWIFYYPWYGPSMHDWSVRVRNPLLGLYSSRDPIVISKHIDWFTGHGVDALFVSWHGINSNEDKTFKDNILKNPLSRDVKFSLIYGPYYQDSYELSRALEDFQYFNSTYFNDERFLKIDGKPVMYFYVVRHEPFIEEVMNIMKVLKRKYAFFAIGDQVYWQDPYDSKQRELMRHFDAISAYDILPSSGPENMEEKVEENFYRWRKVSDEDGVYFIPTAIPD